MAANAFKRIRDFLFKSTNELRRIDEEAAALERDLASAEGGFGKGGGECIKEELGLGRVGLQRNAASVEDEFEVELSNEELGIG